LKVRAKSLFWPPRKSRLLMQFIQHSEASPNPDLIVKHNYYLIFSVDHMNHISWQW
jgi:hypothetical protein